MIKKTARIKLRKRVKKSKKQLDDLSLQAGQGLHKNFIRRIDRFLLVRRFLFAWVLLAFLLGSLTIYQLIGLKDFYKVRGAVAGDVYTEGMVGFFSNANPLFATTDVNQTISTLLFSGLIKYDQNGTVVPDLAESITLNPENEKQYIVVVKPDLYWHDGQTVTSDDVVFTFNTIQNPDVGSPLFSEWSGVRVEKKDDRTVIFTLPNALASFPASLVVGIIPEHILSGIPKASLRSAEFNTISPVGSGPFKWGSATVSGNNVETKEQKIKLLVNKQYHLGVPKLEGFTLRTFASSANLETAFTKKEVTAVIATELDMNKLQQNKNALGTPLTLNAAVGVFFRTSSDILKEQLVRQALVEATNQKEINLALPIPGGFVDSPFLSSMLGYDSSLTQLPYSSEQANIHLDQAGWLKSSNGIRIKDGKELVLQFYTLNNVEFNKVANLIKEQWKKVGVNAIVKSVSQSDLEGVIERREYDALMYGISLGTDPDVFSYWHSSQSSVNSAKRLNFSDYSSGVADASLEAGRTRTDPLLRATKYKSFLGAWRTDAPAVMLYRPRVVYYTNGQVYHFSANRLNRMVDRFYNIQEWMINTALVDKI